LRLQYVGRGDQLGWAIVRRRGYRRRHVRWLLRREDLSRCEGSRQDTANTRARRWFAVADPARAELSTDQPQHRSLQVCPLELRRPGPAGGRLGISVAKQPGVSGPRVHHWWAFAVLGRMGS